MASVVVAEVRVRAAERTATTRAQEKLAKELPSPPLLADPLDEPGGTSPAELDDSMRAGPNVAPEAPPDCAADDLMCHMRRADVREKSRHAPRFNHQQAKEELLRKLKQGTATETELRMLKAICMTDGDRECRNQAVWALYELRDGAP